MFLKAITAHDQGCHKLRCGLRELVQRLSNDFRLPLHCKLNQVTVLIRVEVASSDELPNLQCRFMDISKKCCRLTLHS